jgi:hypothetical protein
MCALEVAVVMSNSKDGKGQPTGPAGGAAPGTPSGHGPGKGPADNVPKKPYATIDLKASEVKEAPGRAEAPPAAAPRSDPSRSDAKPAPVGVTATGIAGLAAQAASTAVKAGDAAKEATVSIAKAGSEGLKASDSKSPELKPTQASPAHEAQAGASSAGMPIPASTPRRGGFAGFLTHMAAGIAGGFLALLGADALGPGLGLTATTGLRTDSSELTKRLALLEQSTQARTASLDASLGQKLAAAEQRLAQLDEVSRRLAEFTATQGRLAEESRALSTRVAKFDTEQPPTERLQRMEQTLATLAAAAGNDGGRVPQLAAITGKIADLEGTLANQLAAFRKTVSAEIENRIATTAEASEAARAGTQRIDRELAGVKTETTRLATRIDGLKTQSDRLEQQMRSSQEEGLQIKSAVESLKGEVAQQLKPLARAQDVSAAVAPLSAKIGTLESSVQGVVKSENDRRANAERIVLALELANLKRAIDRGGPYAGELAEVKRVSGNRIDLAALERASTTGMPTIGDLAGEFRALAYRIIEADAEPAEGSVVDRLIAGAKGIVKVRKTSHSADDRGVEAVVARMEEAQRAGRLADALAESKALSSKARAVAGPWIAKAEARSSVDRALAAVEAQLKASLSGKSTQPSN